MTKVALRIFSIKLLKITYQIAKLINGKNPRAKTEERKMANTSVIVIPEGKICDYVDGKFRNDTPEEYVRQTIEKRLVNEHKYLPKQIRICKSFFSKVLKLLAFQGARMFLCSQFPLFLPLSGKNKGKSYCTLSSSFAASRLASLLACA